jgi:hypothetical protein
MTSNQMVGVVLIVAGLVDAVMAVVLPRRMPAAGPKRLVTVSLLSGAALLVGLGVAFLARR